MWLTKLTMCQHDKLGHTEWNYNAVGSWAAKKNPFHIENTNKVQ